MQFFEVSENPAQEIGQANIKVIGVGGAGNNMVSWLYKKGIKGAEIIACNTDQQHLNITEADKKVLIGRNLTKGLGCGGYPKKGSTAAEESLHELRQALNNTDMVFLCAGMGGGTGTGAGPVLARIANEMKAITIGTVTMPFDIEKARMDKAEFGLIQMRHYCDTVIVIDNNRLTKLAGNLPVQQAFAVANELIATMIKGIVETIAVPSLVNLDFADVKAIMSNGDVAAIGVGSASGESRVKNAVSLALGNPLLEIDSRGANGALIHIEGGPDLTLDEITEIGEIITKELDQDANVIWGARINESMGNKLTVMTILTGVKSPWLLGKSQEGYPAKQSELVSDIDSMAIARSKEYSA